ncbi:E3 ubiquitin-protein ligase RDUF2-like [Typha angustifolia]|uniref:E3 ubiquitin-protein ligase RDUF2-like n=1 Tax=Typha angustifolia TaxID=59011 RepID=UPI003C2F1BA9
MSSPSPAIATATSYWCYNCSRFVRVWPNDAIVCPECDGGFLEEVERRPPAIAGDHRNRIPSAAMYMLNGERAVASGGSRPHHANDLRLRRHRRAAAGGDRSPFNPVIVLRGGREPAAAAASSFELYYDDGAGSGLRPLPETMSEFLMGSGFERLLHQLAQIELNGLGAGGCEHPPASKAAIESMPTIQIAACHIGMESHCAVCKEAFELGSEAREMPCKHIYHQDCILPWLSLRNSCPVCRHEMPTDAGRRESDGVEQSNVGGSEEETVGLTIWRLPGGGFAVGRFAGGRRAGERELPVVYTEVDGGFNNGGAPRRISWSSRGSGSRESGRISGMLRHLFSCFGHMPSSSRPRSESTSAASLRPQSSLIFSRGSRRRSAN